jgi:hypothetical protein
MIWEREMQPVDQAVVAFVVAVFGIFSVFMGYATYIGAQDDRHSSEKSKKK